MTAPKLEGQLVATDQIMSFEEACQLYEFTSIDELPMFISVCDGEYRKGPDCYVWWANEDRIEHHD